MQNTYKNITNSMNDVGRIYRKFIYGLKPAGLFAMRPLDTDDIKSVVFTEFIRHFGELKKVIIDGCVDDHVFYQVQKMIKPNHDFSIISAPKADITYPIVNKADQVANILFRYYSCNNSEGNRYNKFLLTPKLNDYQFLMKQQRFRDF